MPDEMNRHYLSASVAAVGACDEKWSWITSPRFRDVNVARVMVVSITLAFLGGCIQVSAPDKPIVIELNINIRQEVVYRLAADAAKTVQQNESIF